VGMESFGRIGKGWEGREGQCSKRLREKNGLR
jgi:hypothetical protein